MDLTDLAAAIAVFFTQLIAVLALAGAATTAVVAAVMKLAEIRTGRTPLHPEPPLRRPTVQQQQHHQDGELAAIWPFEAGAPEMITLNHDLCFCDVETLGLDPAAPIWEFAAIRLNRDGTTVCNEFQILHQQGRWLDTLPEQFAEDYRTRFDLQAAVPAAMAANHIQRITDGAIIAGSNPSFDMERLTRLLERFNLTPGWHFHGLDIPSMVVGWMASEEIDTHLVWKSDDLSEQTGVLPTNYERHTALGDAEWCHAQWQAMTGTGWVS